MTTPKQRKKIYEGKAKILYEGPEPGTLIQYFKDDATAFNAQKRGTISGKGVLNNRISEHVFTLLGQIGIPHHFIRRLNMREQLIRQVEIVPIEVVVRNVAAGTLSKRLGIEEGEPLPHTLIEYCFKDDALGFDPVLRDGRPSQHSCAECDPGYRACRACLAYHHDPHRFARG